MNWYTVTRGVWKSGRPCLSGKRRHREREGVSWCALCIHNLSRDASYPMSCVASRIHFGSTVGSSILLLPCSLSALLPSSLHTVSMFTCEWIALCSPILHIVDLIQLNRWKCLHRKTRDKWWGVVQEAAWASHFMRTPYQHVQTQFVELSIARKTGVK